MKLHRDDCRSRTCRGCGPDSETNKLKRRVEELEKENAELKKTVSAAVGERETLWLEHCRVSQDNIHLKKLLKAAEGERAAWEKTAADRLTPELSTIAKQRDELAEENMRLKQEIENLKSGGAWPNVKQTHIEDTFSWKS